MSESLQTISEIEEIRYPSEREKAVSIERILDAGMPKHQSVLKDLWELWRSIGLRGILFGVGDCMLAGLMFTVAVYLIVLYQVSVWNPATLHVLLFAVSPFLYSGFYLLTVAKEIMTGMYELKMTCRYNLRQITVLRMLLFSMIALIATALGTVWVRYVVQHLIQHEGRVIEEPSYLRMFSIAFSTLFFYASAQMLVEMRLKSAYSGFLLPIMWCLISGILVRFGRTAAAFLEALPVIAIIVMMAVSVCLYVFCLSRYYKCQKEEFVWFGRR